jgi:hypothetical protein
MFEKRPKTTVFTLAVDGYSPDIRKLTFPLMERYAEHIGANFHVIQDRMFPGWPAAYEKLQIYRLAQELGNDWNIFFDADALVHPELPDLTQHIPLNTVAHYQCDSAGVRFKYDRIFSRDGRNIGSCNWLAVASYQCIELWKPLDDMTSEQAAGQIRPTIGEHEGGITREHLIDDYTLSRNIALYGLKYVSVAHILRSLDLGNLSFFVHTYKCSEDTKVDLLIEALRGWRLPVPDDYPGNNIQGWLTLAEQQWLYHRARRAATVVEIGCWKGRSTHALASGCRGLVLVVDHFKGSPSERESTHAEAAISDIRAEFEQNLQPLADRIRVHQGDCLEFVAQVNNHSIDMVWFDGDHSLEGMVLALKAWAPKAKKFICGHDRDQEGVPEALRCLGIPVSCHAESIWSCEVDRLPAALRAS